MKKTFKDVSVGTKLVVIEVVLVLLFFGAFTIMASHFTSSITEKNAMLDLKNQVTLVKDAVEIYSNAVRKSTLTVSDAFVSLFPERFLLNSSRNQTVGGLSAPVLSCGKTTLNGNLDIVDRFTRATGAVATVFVRKEDDFIRIATSVKKEDGSRAVGTPLGKQHPAYAKVMAGQPYLGQCMLFGKAYSTKYVPVKEGQKVIGLLFVGIDVTDSLRFFKDRIKAIKVGSTGYIFILSREPGPDYGAVVMHPSLEGKKMLNVKDADGREFIKEILQTGNGVIRYRWKNQGEESPREKLVVYTAYDDWHWVIAAGVYTGELLSESINMRRYLAGASIVMAAVMVILLWGASRRMVVVPLARAASFVEAIAEGDLTATIESRSRDEVGLMCRLLQDMAAKLTTVLCEVKAAANNVAMGSQQLATSAEQMAQGASEQAAAAEEASSSVQQMSSNIRQNAENARQTEKIASFSADSARNGGIVVNDAVSAMKEIASKIFIVEEIARQTNLLALNAAIEAARAGEHGKGFAVVAGEVRKLAERAQKAASEISALSSSTVDVAEKAGQLLKEMVPDIQKTAELVQEINAASHEQDIAADQITKAIRQLDRVIQHNASASEDMASTAEELSSQSEQLQNAIAFFRITDHGTDPPPGAQKADIHVFHPATVAETDDGIPDSPCAPVNPTSPDGVNSTRESGDGRKG